jgi:hypothetical protein
MQIWQEVHDGDYSLREIGPNLSLRLKVGEKKDHLVHFDAPRDYWDERLRNAWGPNVNLGLFEVPRGTLSALLGKLDAGRPTLLTEASKLAARTQAIIEEEAKESGDKLPMSETTLGQKALPTLRL